MNNKEYTELLDKYGVERAKCKCCGDDIVYHNTFARYTYRKTVNISGKSYKTIKCVEGTDYHLQVCEKCLYKKFPQVKIKGPTFSVMCKPTQFAFNIPEDVYLRARSKYAMTKQHMIDKYGEEKGLEIWNNYCQKQAETNTLEYKQKKYGMTEEEFKEYNKKRACTLKNFVDRWGQEEGSKRWDQYCKRQSETKKIEYILETHGQEELNRILDARNRGFENSSVKPYSEESQEFFRNLDRIVNRKYSSQYYTKGGEKVVEVENRRYFLDYYIPELNICVEFNGSIYHGDPYLYKDDDRCLPLDNNVTAKDLRDRDSQRYELLKKNLGIKTYVVWESEYRRGMTGERFAKEVLNMNF